jgi:hypothetical protein
MSTLEEIKIIPDIPSSLMPPNQGVQFMSHIQSVLATYHISVVQIIFFIFLILFFLAMFLFQEKFKAVMRHIVRKLIYSSQMSRDGKIVNTTSKTSSNSFNQWLTYLEQTWLAPSDRSTMMKLPANVHLDDKYSVAIPENNEEEEEEEEDDDDVEEIKMVTTKNTVHNAISIDL